MKNFTYSLFLGQTILLLLGTTFGTFAQTSFTSTSVTATWNTPRWNNSADAVPYTSAFPNNDAVNFTSGAYTFINGIGASIINIGNVTVSDNVTVDFTGLLLALMQLEE